MSDRDMLSVRAEAWHEYTYPRTLVELPRVTDDIAFNRAARVYESEIRRLKVEIMTLKARTA